MKISTIFGAVIITVLMAMSHAASAEVAAIKDESECPTAKVSNDKDLVTMLSDLSSEQAAQYFQSTKNRFVFCMVKNPQAESEFAVETQITLKNSSVYPVIIYNLYVNGTNGGGLAVQNASEILFQNLKADNLKTPILLQGKTTLLDSTISCDAANSTPGITVTSSNNTFRKVNINECATGLDLIGSFNTFYELAIRKTATDESQIGSLGMNVSGRNTFYAVMIQNYKVGALLSSTGNRIFGLEVPEGTAKALKSVDGKWLIPSVIAGYTTKVTTPASQPGEQDVTEFIPAKNSIGVYFKASGTLETSRVDGFERGVVVLANKVNILHNFDLGGPLGAVVIGHDPITDKAYQPVVVSKNTFSTKETILYTTDNDKAAYRLLGVEWMGKQVSEADPAKAKGIVGKLLDQNNNSTVVEMTLKREKEIHSKYTQNCDVKIAVKRMEIVFDENGVKTSKYIEPKEKLFECAFIDENKDPIELEFASKARITSNSPTISLMTDDVEIAKLGDVPTVLVGATSSLPIGSGDLGSDQQSPPMGDAQMQTPDGGSFANMPSGGSVPPSDVHDVGDNSGNSSNMIGGVTGLDGGVPTVATGGAESAGAQGLVGSLTSGGGCSLTGALEGQGNAASALIWLLALLPIPILLPMRNRKK